MSATVLALAMGGLPAVAAAQDGDPGRRAAALVRQMTLDEKISLVHGTGFITGNGYTGFTPAISRLGIPAFYLADGPNGVGNGAKGVTAFPAAISNASSWDTRLLRRYGTVLGAEHAGKGNDVALAPTMNILRVPGWGRAFETFSEDPELSGDVGAAEIRGVQTQGVIADAKHFAANNQETDRQTVNALVPERAL
ncbi:MAG: glycoside hydrolase family 3 N-terminal domain-containing protein, partial [Solirubrobacteraceae bacterium]